MTAAAVILAVTLLIGLLLAATAGTILSWWEKP